MKFSRNSLLVLGFVGVFLVSFFLVNFLLQSTLSAYSTPSKDILLFNEMSVRVGPPPNATNIPLDTTITIDTLASASINNLQIIPKTPLSYETIQVSGSITYEKTFYPSQPLEPGTTYQVSVLILNVPVSWTFNTTYVPFNPGLEKFLAKNAILIAFMIASLITTIFGFFIRHKLLKSEY